MNKQFSAIIADRKTWRNPIKRSGDRTLVLIAIQKSRRTSRKGRTKYVYCLEGTDMIYWNRSRDGVIFFPFGYNEKNMRLYHEVFVKQPLTKPEEQWLAMYDYNQVI